MLKKMSIAIWHREVYNKKQLLAEKKSGIGVSDAGLLLFAKILKFYLKNFRSPNI